MFITPWYKLTYWFNTQFKTALTFNKGLNDLIDYRLKWAKVNISLLISSNMNDMVGGLRSIIILHKHFHVCV